MGIESLALGALGSGLGAAGAAYGANKTSESNERINAQNVELQREINKQNEGFMREGWARDDTAVFRRAWDLKQSGLSKTLAAGSSAAASQPIRLESPKLQQTDNHWAQAGADIGKSLGGAPMQALAMDASKAQTNLSRTQAMLQEEQIATEMAKQQNLDATSANALANAGFKKEATRIAHKDANLWTQKNIDVRDRDAISKAAKAFPKVTERIKGFGEGVATDPMAYYADEYERMVKEKALRDFQRRNR